MKRQANEFLAPAKLKEALKQVGEAATKEGIKAVAVGGFVMHLYGSDRMTADVDVAVPKPIKSLRSKDPLEFGGCATEAPNGVPLDMIVRDDEYKSLYAEAIQKAVHHKDSPIPVITPEYLCATKMAAGRSKDESDITYLIVNDKLDIDLTKKIIKKHLGPYAVKEFESTIEIAEWMKHKKIASKQSVNSAKSTKKIFKMVRNLTKSH